MLLFGVFSLFEYWLDRFDQYFELRMIYGLAGEVYLFGFVDYIGYNWMILLVIWKFVQGFVCGDVVFECYIGDKCGCSKGVVLQFVNGFFQVGYFQDLGEGEWLCFVVMDGWQWFICSFVGLVDFVVCEVFGVDIVDQDDNDGDYFDDEQVDNVLEY